MVIAVVASRCARVARPMPAAKGTSWARITIRLRSYASATAPPTRLVSSAGTNWMTPSTPSASSESVMTNSCHAHTVRSRVAAVPEAMRLAIHSANGRWRSVAMGRGRICREAGSGGTAGAAGASGIGPTV
jgi:hypothetical protein